MQPPIDGKFVAYGGPDFSIDTELKGRIIAIEDTELYIAPYANYEYLLLDANRRHPVPGETCGQNTGQPEQCGYTWYQDNILAHDGSYPPIIKLETYGVGGRPTSDDGTAPVLHDLVNNTIRLVQIGDHVRVAGLHVIDYSHTMYYFLPSSSFWYMRGLLKACYAHTELHPYDFKAIELISNLSPGPELYTEYHTLCAPVYPEFYDKSWAANIIAGLAGHFVDSSVQTTQVAKFFIAAPPKPSTPGYFMYFVQSDVVQTGQGTASMTYTLVEDQGVSVTVTVSGNNVTTPLVYRAKYAVEWVLEPIPLVTLNPTTILFGSVSRGDVSPEQTITVTNPGSAPLTITSIGLSGTNPGDFQQTNNCTGTPLASGSSCTVNVVFSPTAVGPRQAALSFTDNASTSPQQVVLKGTGVKPV